ncbi:BON domain-containing protein [Terriglobus aquaticus]|uniref:BON domain-containing protein n=1 Tax=Terriglobus aquaticus TaxID=940139 RepID=A0ABW9KK83_9BACT|nr:BON domain-containing protein [Terriglobus aquaticus]
MKHATVSKFVTAIALAATLSLPVLAQTNDADVQAEVQKSLDSKRFSGVTATVKDGVVTLTGTVDVYATKEDAEHKIHHKKGVVAVSNQIVVGGGPASETPVSDIELRNKLAEKLAYDRVGYGTTAFNSFTIGVQNGVVTLGGVAYGPTDKDSAVSLVSHYPGVRDVIDNIEVAPVSPNDDRIRLAAARAIYGFPSLNKYAIDPAKPIRITVVNGNITLTGVVDNQADKDAAGIRANGVSGAFKVTNDLQVANSSGRER